MKKLLLSIAFLAVWVCHGLESYFTLENDSMAPLGPSDDDFTNGARLELIDDARWHYMLSQTMYAPHDLSAKHHIPGDRPYAGMLIGGVGYELFQNPQSPWTHYAELDFGMIGPAAMCKDTQAMVHKLLDCKKHEGWDDERHGETVVHGQRRTQ